jgi:hypothetical protein
MVSASDIKLAFLVGSTSLEISSFRLVNLLTALKVLFVIDSLLLMAIDDVNKELLVRFSISSRFALIVDEVSEVDDEVELL